MQEALLMGLPATDIPVEIVPAIPCCGSLGGALHGLQRASETQHQQTDADMFERVHGHFLEGF